jgi:nucleotide-binding universal stress UspA family protein
VQLAELEQQLSERCAERAALLARSFPTGMRCEIVAHVKAGDPADEIIRLATALDVDLVFVGAHGSDGGNGHSLGPVARRVVQEVGCPVLVARPKAHPLALERLVGMRSL